MIRRTLRDVPGIELFRPPLGVRLVEAAQDGRPPRGFAVDDGDLLATGPAASLEGDVLLAATVPGAP